MKTRGSVGIGGHLVRTVTTYILLSLAPSQWSESRTSISDIVVVRIVAFVLRDLNFRQLVVGFLSMGSEDSEVE